MKKKALLAALALFAFAATPQNVDIVRQTRAPNPAPVVNQVLGYVPGAGIVFMTVGSGLTMTGSFPNFTLTAPASGITGPAFVDGAVPTGALDGTNAAFTLPSAPNPGVSLQFFRNGVLQKPGTQYTLLGAVVTFNANWIPQAGDDLLASYRR